LPDFRFDKVSDVARGMKALLNPDAERHEDRKSLRQKIKSKRQELARIREEQVAAKGKGRAERTEHKKRKKRVQQEIFELERKLRALKEGSSAGEEKTEDTGALPDFLIIGAKKAGTTFLYHLLTRHPLVQAAAAKELHFFDRFFKEGTEWYKRSLPAPRWKDGRKTITGEASPYMAQRLAPERVAQVVPQARLIALLRNPVERAYSDYQQVVSKGREPRSFEEAIGLGGRTGARKAHLPLGKEGEISEGEGHAGGLDQGSGYLSRGIYVEQLKRWSGFFPREQMLVLKSEEFFENPNQTLKTVFDFLGLPEWEPQEASEEPRERRNRDRPRRNKRNPGEYEEGMDPSTRRRLEEYFEPHNKRLYEFLGVDFGW
jgi:hypothetical protein